MKRLLCLTLMFIFLNPYASADETLSKLENSLFGIDYAGQNDNQRLARLENTVYGKNFNDSNLARIKRLYEDLNGDEIGKEITPKFDTFAEEDELITLQEQVNYPIIDEMEIKVFNKKFSGKDLNTRLASLEKFSFSKTYEKENFAERVERLRKDILGSNFDDMKYCEKDFENYYDYLQTNSLANSFDNPDYHSYREQNFPENDIRKDEMYYFNRTFDNESLSKRKKRIKSIKKAQTYSYGYDDNKFQQKMSTAMQIGAMLLMILAIVL